MPDREKYIEVLSKTVKTVKDFNEDAPIKISLQCVEDIIELLKEQEAVEPVKKDMVEVTSRYEYDCPCGAPLLIGQPYCAGCGRSVKWDNN